MPMYEFVCQECSHRVSELMTVDEHEKLRKHPEKGSREREEICPECLGGVMLQTFGVVHTQVGHDWDAQPWSKTFKEHNEKLKKREGRGTDYLTPTDKIRERYTGDRFKNS